MLAGLRTVSRSVAPLAEEDLSAIQDDALDRGVEMSLHFEEDGVLWLGRIERTWGRKGIAGEILDELLESADGAGLTVRAAVEAGNDRLLDYYLERDFEVAENGIVHLTIERQPQG